MLKNRLNLFVVACSILLCPAARAATGSIGLVDGAGLQYFINTNITFSTSSSDSGAASEASYTRPAAADTLAGGLTSSTLNDMFDGYGAMCVSFTNASGPCQTGNANYVFYNKNGVIVMEAAGRQVVFNSQNLGHGIVASRKVYVPQNDEFIRWMNIFTNTGSSPVTFNVISGNNLGSDSNTLIVDDSTGTASPITNPATTWVATMQNFSGNYSSDPRIGHVLQSPGATVPMTGINFVQGDDNPYWSYTVTLDPNQTVIILWFTIGAPTKVEVVAKTKEIAALPGSALQGMTATEIAEVGNFAVPCAAQRNQCNDVIANLDGSCTPVPLDGTPCNDNNACTSADRCVAGACIGHALDCGALAAQCHVGICVPAFGCTQVVAGNGTACDDGNPCTTDQCNGGGACIGTPIAATSPCDDSNPCTSGDQCNGGGVCVGTPDNSKTCDDGNPCTADHCAGGACVGTPVAPASPCDDKNPCTTGDQCNGGGACVGVPVSNGTACIGANPCSAGVCVGTNCISTTAANGQSCDDHQPCTVHDTCFGGQCGGVPMDCSFLTDACHLGVCDPSGTCMALTTGSGPACSGGGSLALPLGNPTGTSSSSRGCSSCAGGQAPEMLSWLAFAGLALWIRRRRIAAGT